MGEQTDNRLVGRIVSGGQTGVDRAALDVALRLGVPHGGWCPRGRIAEDGPIPPRYELHETRSAAYGVRTQRNVLDSDGTLIVYRHSLRGGTLLTHRLAQRHDKPCLTIDLATGPRAADVVGWLREARIGVLNVAGPRESSAPGIGAEAADLLAKVLVAVNSDDA